MNELSDDILDSIFLCIKEIKDIRSFIGVNKRFNERYKERINKYKLILYVNQDYLNFYEILHKNNYTRDRNYIEKIIVKAFMNIPTIRYKVVDFYDLRYVFELMFLGYGLQSEDIKLYNIHFYIHFYDKIKKCLKFNREDTLNEIEKSSYLFTLKQSSNKIGKSWASLIK